jgi:hypothetical protein
MAFKQKNFPGGTGQETFNYERVIGNQLDRIGVSVEITGQAMTRHTLTALECNIRTLKAFLFPYIREDIIFKEEMKKLETALNADRLYTKEERMPYFLDLMEYLERINEQLAACGLLPEGKTDRDHGPTDEPIIEEIEGGAENGVSKPGTP